MAFHRMALDYVAIRCGAAVVAADVLGWLSASGAASAASATAAGSVGSPAGVFAVANGGGEERR